MLSGTLSITLLFLLELALVDGTTDVCHVGSSRDRTIQQNCRRGGCAVVSFSSKMGDGVAEYKCLSDLDSHHPAFITLACEYSTASATCYDQNSSGEIPWNIKKLGVIERTFGEVLRTAGMNRFCCCRGSYCNAENEHINRHFRLSPHRKHPADQSLGSSVVASSTLLVFPLVLFI